jgi:hypothetical protein
MSGAALLSALALYSLPRDGAPTPGLVALRVPGVTTEVDEAPLPGLPALLAGFADETVYVNPYYTVKNRSRVTKHIFVGGTRIASRVIVNGAETHTLYFHTDHLQSTQYITGRDGKVAQPQEVPTSSRDPWAPRSQPFLLRSGVARTAGSCGKRRAGHVHSLNGQGGAFRSRSSFTRRRWPIPPATPETGAQ